MFQSKTRPVVVIIGGGVAGLTTAQYVAKRRVFTVVLVDGREAHYAPYQAPLSNALVSAPYHECSRRHNFSYVRGLASQVDLHNRFVVVGGKHISFDYIIFATGSVPYAGSVDKGQHAFVLWSPDDSKRIQHHLQYCLTNAGSGHKPAIAIVGGGKVGVQLAGGVMDFIQTHFPATQYELSVYEQASRLMPRYTHAAARLAEQYIAMRGGHVHCNTLVAEVHSSALTLGSGDIARADIVLWAASSQGVAIHTTPSLPLTPTGHVVVNGCFQIRPYTHVFAIGDAASTPILHRKPSAEEVVQEAEYVAHAIQQLCKNRQPLPFVPTTTSEIIPLGEATALYVRGDIARLSPFYLARYASARRAYMRKLRGAFI